MKHFVTNTLAHSLFTALAATFALGAEPPTVPLSLALSGPGRIGFYIDYSERTSPGEHVFYVCRTHGTEGAVGATYTSYGDAHMVVTGSVSWADGEADIKRFKINVPSKPSPGEHRIWVQLSDPTNGAVLHFGDYTRAYGVIDDGTTDSGFAGHDGHTDPLFEDSPNGDYRLRMDSPCRGTGVSGSDKGVYLTGAEIVGPDDPPGRGGILQLSLHSR